MGQIMKAENEAITKNHKFKSYPISFSKSPELYPCIFIKKSANDHFMARYTIPIIGIFYLKTGIVLEFTYLHY